MRLLVLVGLAAALPGQANPDRILVVVQQAIAPASALFEVDPVTGAVVPLPSFPSAFLPPLALALDPATREPIVALQAANGSLLVRVHVVGQQVLGESVLGTVPGTVVGMSVPSVGDLFVAIGGANGGILRVDRQCCGAQTFWTAPGISVLSEPVVVPGKLWAAQDRSPGPPTLHAFLDANPGTAATSLALTLLPGARITGVHEFPGGFSSRVQLVVDTLGRLHRMELWPWTLGQVQLAPAIPAGGARRMKAGPSPRVYVLGGATDPTLKWFWQTVTSTSGALTPLTQVASLPGDPVDFVVVAPASARVVRFGAPCAAPAGGSAGAVGVPALGNAAFALRLTNGLPGALALCAAGFSERTFLGVPLPLPLGTCELLVAPDVVAVQVTDAAGTASQPLPIPATPSLAGVIVHTQWGQDPAAFRTSDALALHLF